jgi:hypothetical protein
MVGATDGLSQYCSNLDSFVPVRLKEQDGN